MTSLHSYSAHRTGLILFLCLLTSEAFSAFVETTQALPTPTQQGRLANDQLYAGVRSQPRRPVHFGHYEDIQIEGVPPPRHARSHSSWYLGLQTGIPEVIALDMRHAVNRHLSIRLLAAPAVPFNIRVELPQDKLSSRAGIVIEHPAVTIPFKAQFGPNIGLEFWWFPFAQHFFMHTGVGYREFSLDGRIRTPLIIRPEGSENSITTRTEFALRAKSASRTLLLRTGLGWNFHLGPHGYLFIQALGVLQPLQSSTRVKVRGDVFSPGVDNNDVSEALLEMKVLKEQELADKAAEELHPATKQTLPMLSIGAGWRF